MKKKFIEVTFDGFESFDYPIEWFDKLVDEKRYFQVLGIYEKKVDGDNDI